MRALHLARCQQAECTVPPLPAASRPATPRPAPLWCSDPRFAVKPEEERFWEALEDLPLDAPLPADLMQRFYYSCGSILRWGEGACMEPVGHLQERLHNLFCTQGRGECCAARHRLASARMPTLRQRIMPCMRSACSCTAHGATCMQAGLAPSACTPFMIHA